MPSSCAATVIVQRVRIVSSTRSTGPNSSTSGFARIPASRSLTRVADVVSSRGGGPLTSSTSTSGSLPTCARWSATERISCGWRRDGIGTTAVGRCHSRAQRESTATLAVRISSGAGWSRRHRSARLSAQAGSSAKAIARPSAIPRILPLTCGVRGGQSFRGSTRTSRPRKKVRAAVIVSWLGRAPGSGSRPSHTVQRPHGCGSGSSRACCRNCIRQPSPWAYRRIRSASAARTARSSSHFGASKCHGCPVPTQPPSTRRTAPSTARIFTKVASRPGRIPVAEESADSDIGSMPAGGPTSPCSASGASAPAPVPALASSPAAAPAPAPVPSSASTFSACSGSGIPAVAKYSQIRSSPAEGTSTAVASGSARPARPTCW